MPLTSALSMSSRGFGDFGLSIPFSPKILLISGGGGGNYSGAGAGGYFTNWASDTNGGNYSQTYNQKFYKGISYYISIGAGGATGSPGSISQIVNDFAYSGAAGVGFYTNGNSRGSGSGGGPYTTTATTGGAALSNGYGGSIGGGYSGSPGAYYVGNAYGAGGGAGSAASGANGGSGLVSTIDGASTIRAGGGGGGGYGTSGSGGSGGGGNGTSDNSNGGNGQANTGSGGGGKGYSSPYTNNGGAGGSGLIIMRYPSSYGVPTVISGTLSFTSTTIGSDTVLTITAGSAQVKW